MKIKVTKKGAIIPPRFLKGIDEVEIRKENGVIVIIPIIEGDPIIGLGNHPVVCGLSDASKNHDKYLYHNAT